MSVNKRQIVFIGEEPSVSAMHGGQSYLFRSMEPKWVPEALAQHLLRKHMGRFIDAEEQALSLRERYPDGGVIALRRWGPTGDLLMFRAAVAALVRSWPELRPLLRCTPEFAHLFNYDGLWTAVWPIGAPRPPEAPKEAIPSVLFDRTVEIDHQGVAEEDRVGLFLRALSPEKIEVRPEDWAIPIPPQAREYVATWLRRRGLQRERRERPLVAVQVRGSAPVKTIPRSQMIAVTERLVVAGADVVLIEPVEALCWVADRVFSMPGRDALHSIELMRHADMAITMDSGALWMAHAAACPTLAVLGPTRPEQRIVRHPLYADGLARAVTLNRLVVINKKVGCPPCFEQAKACGGRFTCMQGQPADVVVGSIVEAALELLAAVRESRPRLAGHDGRRCADGVEGSVAG